jgi:threonine aldolase
MSWIDLRSDACSLPTEAMRRAMADAACGNDDFFEDPTITELEQEAAALLGKPRALFVQSGTMANLIAVMTHVQPGQTILTSKKFHVFDYEQAAMRRVAQCDFQFVDDRTVGCQTQLLWDELAETAVSKSPLISLENSINRLGGTLLDTVELQRAREYAVRNDMKIHLDGARLLNAAVALGVQPSQLSVYADTVSMVFTKALAAPTGAVLAGDTAILDGARRLRWMLGGGWKQGGLIAAACLVGIRTMRGRIADDHVTARRLAEGLNSIQGLSVDLPRVATNIVFFSADDPDLDLDRLTSYLASNGVRIGRFKQDRRSRLVTHHNVGLADVDRVLEYAREAVADSRRPATAR